MKNYFLNSMNHARMDNSRQMPLSSKHISTLQDIFRMHSSNKHTDKIQFFLPFFLQLQSNF